MRFEQAVATHARFRTTMGFDGSASDAIQSFLGWATPDEAKFAQDARIVLASAEFSKELTTTVLWLNQRGLDIRCVRLRPYKMGDKLQKRFADEPKNVVEPSSRWRAGSRPSFE